MNITFTKDELRDLMGKLGQWFSERDKYVLDHLTAHITLNPWAHDQRWFADAIIKTRQQYEKENPRPDWRQLL